MQMPSRWRRRMSRMPLLSELVGIVSPPHKEEEEEGEEATINELLFDSRSLFLFIARSI